MPQSARPTYVLGTGLSHDGSACLLKDGVIYAAIEKERLTRVKHDGGNDAAAVSYCLAAAGIGIDDVDLVVQNANFGMLDHGHDWWGGARVLPSGAPVVSISHHLAHAYSTIGTSPFDEAAVLVIDGCGNAYDECIDLAGAIVPDPPDSPDLARLSFEKDSYYQFTVGGLSTIYKDFSPWGIGNRHYPMVPTTTRHSLGGLYLAASMYVFNGFEDPGKLMGLAPYGRPGVYNFEIFDLRDGRAFVRAPPAGPRRAVLGCCIWHGDRPTLRTYDDLRTAPRGGVEQPRSSQARLRAALGVIRLAESSMTSAAHLATGLFTTESLVLVPFLAPGILLGVPLGAIVVRHLRTETFRRICMSFDAWIVAFACSRLLVELGLVASPVRNPPAEPGALNL